jgi:uncharacterized protein (PEP-CTERM system associated)
MAMPMAMEPRTRMRRDNFVVRFSGLQICLLLSCAVAGGVPLHVLAGDWSFSPRVSGSESWSDNINLSASGGKQHDYVTQLTPGIGVSGRGNRLTLNFDYQAGLVHYARARKSNELQHRLQASGTVHVIKALLTVDARSTVSQRNQSETGTQATDGLTLGSSRSQAVTFGVSPTLHWRFGRFAESQLTYSRDEVKNSGSLSTSLDSLSLRVSSGSRFSGLPWTLSASTRREDNSTGTRSTFRDMNGTVRYPFSRRYAVSLSGGYSDNDLTGSGVGNGSSLNWRATGIWTPAPRTNLEFGYGRQPSGNSFSLSASHKMRRAVFNASYQESITTTAFQQSQATLFAREDAFGNTIENPGNQQVDVATNEASLGDATFVSRSFSFGVSVAGRRSSASLNLTNNRRSSSTATPDNIVSGISANASRTLSRHTSVNANANMQISDPGGSNDKSTQIGLGVGVSHTVFRDVTARMNYRHQRVSSDAANSSYQENRISADVAVRF